ncbi:septal ring lytic transglycosylase RlpA family protein [Treponema zioleckii]|uniref:septal ring lytic transglycosylase RlpA family protein n=1 Tax=Treponema zioleckii TaxID=331680 RepID=UPI00168BA0D6
MKKFFLMILMALSLTSVLSANELFKSGVTASYYADKFHGRKTSNGEIFNMYQLTAAHKTLPFNTVLKVTNLANGKSVQVRINDRGPFVKGREIDLSKAAAVKLDMIKSGTAKVKLEIVSGKNSTSSSAKSVAKKAQNLDPNERWDIQLGAFEQKANAQQLATKLMKAGFKNVIFQNVKSKGITRVAIRNVPTDEVQGILDNLENKGFTDYFVRERAKTTNSDAK